jgi:hypothetical protein
MLQEAVRIQGLARCLGHEFIIGKEAPLLSDIAGQPVEDGLQL